MSGVNWVSTSFRRTMFNAGVCSREVHKEIRVRPNHRNHITTILDRVTVAQLARILIAAKYLVLSSKCITWFW